MDLNQGSVPRHCQPALPQLGPGLQLVPLRVVPQNMKMSSRTAGEFQSNSVHGHALPARRFLQAEIQAQLMSLT